MLTFKAGLEIIGINPFVFVPPQILAQIFKEVELPEGTDSIVAGASSENEEALIVREPTARDKVLDKINPDLSSKMREMEDDAFLKGSGR